MGSGAENVPDLFIVGVGRSGTSLLMSMLNAHPEISFPPETGLLRRYGFSRPKSKTPGEVRGELDQDKNFGRLELQQEEVLSHFSVTFSEVDGLSLYKEIMRQYFEEQDNCPELIGDKDPKLIEYLPDIHDKFPSAKVIHIIRDPRDVYLSRRKAEWSSGRGWFLQAFTYRIQYKLSRKWGRELLGENYYEVQYEDLLTRPEQNLRRLTDFLELEYNTAMLEFGDKAENLVAKDEEDWKENVTGPLLKDNYDKWKYQLKINEVYRIEEICSQPFREGLYQRAEFKPSLRQKIGVLPLKFISSILEFAYTRKLWLKRKLRN